MKTIVNSHIKVCSICKIMGNFFRIRKIHPLTSPKSLFFCLHLGTEKKCSSTALILINFAKSNKTVLQLPPRTSLPVREDKTFTLHILPSIILHHLHLFLKSVNSDRKPSKWLIYESSKKCI